MGVSVKSCRTATLTDTVPPYLVILPPLLDTRTHARTHAHTHAHAPARVRTHTQTRTLVCTHARTYTHTHTHIHMNLSPQRRWLSNCSSPLQIYVFRSDVGTITNLKGICWVIASSLVLKMYPSSQMCHCVIHGTTQKKRWVVTHVSVSCSISNLLCDKMAASDGGSEPSVTIFKPEPRAWASKATPEI